MRLRRLRLAREVMCRRLRSLWLRLWQRLASKNKEMNLSSRRERARSRCNKRCSVSLGLALINRDWIGIVTPSCDNDRSKATIVPSF